MRPGPYKNLDSSTPSFPSRNDLEDPIFEEETSGNEVFGCVVQGKTIPESGKYAENFLSHVTLHNGQ